METVECAKVESWCLITSCLGRLRSTAQEDSPFSGRKTPILKHGYLALIYKQRKGYGRKSSQETRMEPQRRLAVNADNFSATPAAKSSPNVTPCIHLDLVSRPRVATCSLSSAWPAYTIAQACTLESSLKFHLQRTEF